LIEAQASKPAPCQVHAQLFHQLALAGDAVQIADEQDAQQQFDFSPTMDNSVTCVSWRGLVADSIHTSLATQACC
jgi:hypothetical protein